MDQQNFQKMTMSLNYTPFYKRCFLKKAKNGFKYHPTLSKVVYPGIHQSSPTTATKPTVARVDVLLQPVPASVQ